MAQHETTFIVDPVLSNDEIKAASEAYVDLLKGNGADIVAVDDIGLRQLAYPIKRRTSGVYYCVEYKLPAPAFIDKLELALRRDERILRFLTVRLDKYAVKYNEDKRNGLIGKVKKKEKKKDDRGRGRSGARTSPRNNAPAPKAPAPAPKAPAPKPEPVAAENKASGEEE